MVPKAILFDVGGVCVLSPFQAILDYELANSIPVGYINYAIQKGPPDTGAWQLLERGEVPLNDVWFTSFKSQLSRPAIWHEFWTSQSLKKNAGRSAVPNAGVAKPPDVPDIDAKRLFWQMMKISRTPDPYMYPALKKLKQSGKFVLGALSNTVNFPAGILDDDGVVFDKALRHDAAPGDPHAAANEPTDIRDCFDVFVSSAHVGLRKPDPRIYELAVRELGKVAEERGMGSVEPGDVVFLDDIGGNLKGAREVGLRTVRVVLGRTREAVGELEGLCGVELGGGGKSRL
ncbi:HAD-like protein [Byssothecium circinans]|uniref:HAD-like protein n=1 Tax=Byssothecium circinans TaxID=147558 RepID=A0A6A5UGV0_9PLEO|nr:HAD-like protein [Byssothecium circinans]